MPRHRQTIASVKKAFVTARNRRLDLIPLCAKISETPSRPAFSVEGGEGNSHEEACKWRCTIPPFLLRLARSGVKPSEARQNAA